MGQKSFIPKNIIELIFRDLRLLFESPREYLYSYTFSTKKKANIQAFNPKVRDYGRELVKKITIKYPKLTIFFMGSASFGIAGQNDIDLLIDCDPNDFSKYTPFLNSLFGKPDRVLEKELNWHIKKDGMDLEVMLIDPKHHVRNTLVTTYLSLKDSPELLKMYESLKLSSNGISQREYKKRRIEFFNWVEKQKRIN